MPKILMVTTIGLTAKAFLLPYAYHYRRLGCQVDLLASDAQGDQELEAGFDHVHEIEWRRTPLAWQNVTAGYKLSKIVASQGYDIVHVHTPVAGFVTRLALRRQRKAGRPQVIYTAHGFHFFKGGRPLRNLLFRTMERLAGCWTDRLIVMNREDLDAAVKYKILRQGDVCCMPGIGFDPEQYDPDSIPQQRIDAIRAQFGLSKQETLFLVVAELQGRKRHTDLLHAFSRLQSTTAQLLIAGTGPLLEDLKKLATQLGIADRVHFLGFRSDVPALMRAADALVLTSDQEGLPRCVIEALALKTVVIGTSARGTRDLLENGSGILVPVGDIAAIAAAMQAVADRSLDLDSLIAKGRETVQQCRVEVSFGLHDQLYRDVLLHAQESDSSYARQRGWRLVLKGVADRVCAAAGLMILSPLLLGISLLIRVTMGAPVLFRQERPGVNCRPFTLLKFRTMRNRTDQSGKLLPDGERLTRLGRLLRATSLDELPQLWNVLRGDLSLVGPRPLLMEYLERYTAEQMRRQDVLPGITGWAQINGRNQLSWPKKFDLDLWYVDHWSLKLDFYILCKTLWQVVKRDGISQPGHATMPEFGVDENYPPSFPDATMLSKAAKNQLFVALLTVTATVAGLCYQISDATYHWHDSTHYSRVIVNAQEGIETRPRQWFAQDKLITDYTISNADLVGRDKAVQEYTATRELLRSYGLAVGTYISGTTVMPESRETHWPWSVVPLEWMASSSRYNGHWPDMDYRKLIDVTDPATRHSFQQGIKRLWEQTPAPVRFIDNAAVHRSAGKGQPWSSYCANIEEIRKIGESMGSLQIFNIPMHIGELSDEEASQLIAAVGKGGIMLEMPWNKGIQIDAAATERARARYRQFLDTGMGVILLSSGGAPSEVLVKWVSTWRKPTDHLYFAGAFWKEPDAKLYGPGAAQ